MNFRNWVRTAKRWYWNTPERALDEAYRCALLIRAIEDEHFTGQRVAAENADHCEQVFAYFDAEVKKNLKTMRIRLAEFRATSGFIGESDRATIAATDIFVKERAAVIIEKLNFIDSVLNTYQTPQTIPEKLAVSLTTVPPQNPNAVAPKSAKPLKKKSTNTQQKMASAASKTGAVPRSILNTFSRVRQELDPQTTDSEGEVVKRFRQARNRTAISVKFLLLLVIVPLLTHQITKTFIVQPLIEQHFLRPDGEVIFLNQDLQEEAFAELEQYEKKLHFSALLGLAPELNEERLEAELHAKAREVSETYRHRGTDAISNVFSDIFSLIAFVVVLVTSRREVQILKDFLDEIIYGLSDSAKAFLIILFTDMFVGFHSPHGWEVILEGISHHLGLPESRDFNFLFIATFPVILDTVLKYWIFRYLNRISPSAVATYKTMNE